ncbi:SprT-like domain-containing protein [Kineococcus rubinsiae]|uniref:SprT-like domain-containing protein n=1 Tax=Kineococcus rubinsiae TaxID=2609562 RepID=UPI00142F9D63|nr:SprT-like domain-containing protein [Kineococcus rubinsiae]NIZ92464.1 SprT family zinc-dependent metalloprotease [Kineococcus rubinsiae]
MDVGAAVAMAEGVLAQHGLRGWTVVLDRAKKRAGVCRFDRRQIGLSRELTALHSEAEVRETVLHEVAHALTGPGHGHDARWRATARRIGSTGERLVAVTAPRAPAPWVGTCPAGHTADRHRRPERVTACGVCGTAFDVAHVLTWRHHGRLVDLGEAYRSELARLAGADAPTASRLAVGTLVRVRGAGRFAGTVGRIVKRGRTKYHVATARGVLAAPFALVEAAPVSAAAAPPAR